ncbi:MAG: hypothetical protein ACFFC7_20675 [Candidatus Hermodarchaeota archaeon]
MMGIIFHHLGSIILGIIYGIIVIIIVNYISAIPFDISNLMWIIVLGVIWGLVVMIVGQMILIPIIYTAIGLIVTTGRDLMIIILIDHLIYGVTTGIVAWLLNERRK